MRKTLEERFVLNMNERVLRHISRSPLALHARIFNLYHFFLTFYYLLLAFLKTPLRLTRRGINRYVTACYENEGIGGQFCRYLSARIISRKFGVTFVHRPFEISFHGGGTDWETFLKFEPDPVSGIADAMADCKRVQLPEFGDRKSTIVRNFLTLIIRYAHPESNVVFVLPRFSAWPFDLDPDILKAEREYLMERYRRARQSIPQGSRFTGGKIRVAVVVRRGEIADMMASEDRFQRMRARDRWLEADWYVNVLKQIIGVLGEENLSIQVFSDEPERLNLGALSDLAPDGLDLLADDPVDQPLRMFHSLATAEIVVCGLTGCCFPAGLIGEGIKLRPAQPSAIYFPELEDWVPVDERGGFDSEALKELRMGRLSAKPAFEAIREAT